ncbi:MAG: hypothetical protein ACE5J9_00535 [Methanosarcinales archaeon]
MVELRSDPYVLKPRSDILETELEFRKQLNVSWCKGVLFNVVAFKNSIAIVEYDALLWNDDSILFIEYKDSKTAYKNLTAKRVQKKNSLARNIARGLGYPKYNFTIVVNGIEESTIKGNTPVISLKEVYEYIPDYNFTILEIEYISKLIRKYNQIKQNELTKEYVIADLEKLKSMIEQSI